MYRWLVPLLFLVFASMAPAQERPRAILVLDASGSMWGQIDGVAKITIAQDVIGGLLETLPPEQELGLTAYGHRRKGDCSDIETLIAPGGDQRANIAAAVNAIKPKGKTPLSEAVIQAAEALRYTEEAATVILVSDGRETCEFDPCAVGRQLEEAGINFTAHVIGFDVTEQTDRAQLQCLAEETGGTFRTASSADELADALTVVSAPPEPEPVDVTLQAINGRAGPVITEDLSWSLFDADGNPVDLASADAMPSVMLEPWSYRAQVVRGADGAEAGASFTVEDAAMTVTVELPKWQAYDVTFNAKDGAGGPTITKGLVWTVKDDAGGILLQGGTDYTPTLKLFPGDYSASVLREVDNASGEVGFSVDGYDTVVVVLPKLPPPLRTFDYRARNGEKGDIIRDPLVWDIIAGDGTYVLESEQVDKGTIKLAPGDYTVEVLRPVDEATASASFRITSGNRSETLILPEFQFAASVEGPLSVVAGSEFDVAWTGPDLRNDFIAVSDPEKRGATWVNYTYTSEGSPVSVLAPPEPGEYELRYIQNDRRVILATQKITVTPVEATLSTSGALVAGDTVPVGWTGPDYHNDFISVVPRGEDNWINYAYTRDGSPANLVLPPEPGDYDLLYVMNQKRTVLARVPITVTGLDVTVSPPTELKVGETVPVPWTGPDYKNDFIAVVKRGEDRSWINYKYTKDGSPAQLLMPAEPGEYDVLYVLSQDNEVMARVPVTVSGIEFSVSPPAQAAMGDTVAVPWVGPDYKDDFIAVVKRGEDRGWINYAYTRNGAPAQLQMPPQPGEYDVLYVLRQDNQVSARMPIEVSAVDMSVQAPSGELVAGATVPIPWVGPDYKNDFVVVVERGADRGWINYSYTRDGAPAQLLLPPDGGEYDILYVLAQDNTVGARVSVSVADASATLSAASTGAISATLPVDWTGPDYGRDFIAVVRRGESRGWLSYRYTSEGSPAQVQLPDEPGDYDLLYVLAQDNTVISRIPVTVE